jgi:hypothetical protein
MKALLAATSRDRFRPSWRRETAIGWATEQRRQTAMIA